MIEVFDLQTIDLILRMVIAMLLGALLGTERRILAHKMAGMRTYALVSMGSALFVIISQIVFVQAGSIPSWDLLRMASQIVVGIGFLGAGMIIFHDSKLTGLTTASSLWVSAGIGIAVGFGLYELAIITTVLTLFIFIVLFFIENKLKEIKLPQSKSQKFNNDEEHFNNN